MRPPFARGRDEYPPSDNQLRTEYSSTGTPIWRPIRWINAARYGSLYLRLLLRRIASLLYIAPIGRGECFGRGGGGVDEAVGRCCIYSRHVLISPSRHRSSASRLQSSLFPRRICPGTARLSEFRPVRLRSFLPGWSGDCGGTADGRQVGRWCERRYCNRNPTTTRSNLKSWW